MEERKNRGLIVDSDHDDDDDDIEEEDIFPFKEIKADEPYKLGWYQRFLLQSCSLSPPLLPM